MHITINRYPSQYCMDEKRYHIYSQYRRRYTDAKYDLDLSYITKHIIAMSFPETGVATIIKNSMS